MYEKPWTRSKKQNGLCIYHLWYLPIMLCHSVTGCQPYKLMFGHKVPTVSNVWLMLAKYNYQCFQSKSAWVNKQHELTLAANRRALKNIKQTAKKRALHGGGSTLNISKDNLLILRDHPEGRHKIWDNYKSELFVIVLKHKNPNVYTILPMCWGQVHMVNQQQLIDLGKSSIGDSGDIDPTDSSPKTNLPFTNQRELNRSLLPTNIHNAQGLRLRKVLYYKYQI